MSFKLGSGAFVRGPYRGDAARQPGLSADRRSGDMAFKTMSDRTVRTILDSRAQGGNLQVERVQSAVWTFAGRLVPFDRALPLWWLTRCLGANEIAGAGGRWCKRPETEYHATIAALAGAKRISVAKGTHQRQGWRARTWCRRSVPCP
jgi:hypothetical protein